MAEDRAAKAGLELRIPPASLCTDNGAMVAALGAELLRAGIEPSELGLAVDSSASVSVVSM
jgi:N6-L-threonylcarbamoyladenine synthase